MKTITKKRNSAIFLATVLVLGTFAAISPSFIIGAQADSYYGGMDNYKKSSGKDVSVKNVKCNNINVNVNGLELGVFPPFLSGGLASEAADGTSDASPFAGNGANDGSQINDFRFICINNNNNIVAGGEQPPTPPEPTTASLSVSKTVTCTPSVANLQAVCDAIIAGTGLPEGQITPNEFNIIVTGNNPDPSRFDGSTTPVVVTLGPGPYQVSERDPPLLRQTLDAIFAQFPEISNLSLNRIFSGDCTQEIIDFVTVRTGTIAAGESQTCNIENEFRIS